jgi:TRAP-type mannitol/chloroaromatic compound transport system permease large subunit
MVLASALVFVVPVALGVPVALVFLAVTGLRILLEPAVMDGAVAQRIVAGTQSFPLLAVPLFVLAGELMNASGITARVMRLALVLRPRVSGGLAKTNILPSMMLWGVSGSASGDAAMRSRVLVPQMAARGYTPALRGGAHGVLGAHRAADPARHLAHPLRLRDRHLHRRALPRRRATRACCSPSC